MPILSHYSFILIPKNSVAFVLMGGGGIPCVCIFAKKSHTKTGIFAFNTGTRTLHARAKIIFTTILSLITICFTYPFCILACLNNLKAFAFYSLSMFFYNRFTIRFYNFVFIILESGILSFFFASVGKSSLLVRAFVKREKIFEFILEFRFCLDFILDVCLHSI